MSQKKEKTLKNFIVDRRQVFRFLASENILSPDALVAGLTATSLMILKTLIKSK